MITMVRSSSKHTTVCIPTQLAKKIEKRIEDTGFGSISGFIVYVLRELISEEKMGEPLTKEDVKRIKERLEALGYKVR